MHRNAGEETLSFISCQDVTSGSNFYLHVKTVGVYVLLPNSAQLWKDYYGLLIIFMVLAIIAISPDNIVPN